jgi:signal transduction histidine kinase
MLGALRQADESDAGLRDNRDDAGPDAETAGAADGGSAGGGGTVPLSPAPGLADLDRLIARTAGAGVRVDVTRCGQCRELPASIDLSAYRIVQEALTNVVKHARTSACQVLIGYGRDELVLEVTDNGAGLPAMALAGDVAPRHGLQDAIGGSGHGIIGMRERVSLLSGEFSAGPLPGYGFQVSAHLPLPQGK